MSDPSITHTTRELLLALRTDDDEGDWRRFDLRYRPLLAGVLRRMGLRDADAEDLAQEVLVRFITALRDGSFQAGPHRLRGWLVRTARWRAIDHFRVRRPDPVRDSVLVELPGAEAFEAAWEREQKERVLAEAVRVLRTSGSFIESTVQVFERTVLQERPVQEVADELGMTVGAAYVAKHRYTKSLKAVIARIEAAYNDDPSIE
ncbi:MAG: sigma-70 family RNA polymerase sigma factor [Planctomycetota bacterium]